MPPRELVIDMTWNDDSSVGIRYCYSPTKTPALLHACGESRSHLQDGHYSKAFKQGSEPCYIWVNFDIDTIRIVKEDLFDIAADWDSICHLTLECLDFNSFWWYVGDLGALESTNLKNLTIIDMGGASGRVREHWWQEWTLNLVVEFYYKCNPMPFYTRVVARSDPNGIEVNTDNYIGLYRSYRKAANEADHDFGDPYESESEHGRERVFPAWEHTGSCGCSNR